VNQKEYENYLKEHNMTGVNTIPDSILPQMMETLQADIFARPAISQPGGEGTEFSARISYVYPKDNYTKDDYTLESEWYSVESEKKSWKLAGEYIDVIVNSRELIAAMLKARPSYNMATNGKPWSKSEIRAIMEKALENYRKLVDMEPDNRTFNYMVAMSLMGAKRYAEAIAEFNKLLTNIDPEHVPTHETLANHYFYSTNSDFEGALRHFSKLAEIDPLDYTYTQYWALSLTRLERPDEAIEVFERLIRIEDEDADVRHQMADYFYNKASALETAGNSASAEPWIRKALEYMTRSCEICRSAGNPADTAWITTHCQRLNFLATLQHELNDTGKEIETLQQIVELDPAFPGACYNLGIYAHQAKNFEKAIDFYQKALNCADDAQKAALYYQIGVINFRQFKMYPQAITALTSAIEVNDAYTNEMVYYLRGTACYDYANALDYGSDEVADIKALIRSGTLSHASTDRALELYAKSLADFRKVTTGDPRVVRSIQQHVDSIARRQERLTRIKQQINYNQGNK
ncbi:tetratricopeptide repeat protein, partial [Gemmatimonadota bacterium]